jgi:hypothetical protein
MPGFEANRGRGGFVIRWGIEPVGQHQAELVYVNWLITLQAAGKLLGALRRCVGCNSWVLPVRRGQTHCGALCRRKDYASKPTSKEMRRRYTKRYYREQLTKPSKSAVRERKNEGN